VEGVRLAMEKLEKEKPDVILVASHGGLDREPGEATARPGEPSGENSILEIAERFPSVAAIVYGHTHRREPGRRVGPVLIVQPRNWAEEVARIDLTLVREGSAWRLAESTSVLLPVTLDTLPDPKILEIAQPYQDAAEKQMTRRVADIAVELSGARGRFEDSALVDAIHEVQLHYSKADVSFTQLFRPEVRIPPGSVTVRDIGALYIYENELYALEGSGRMVREALENASRYFLTCPDPTCTVGPLIDRAVYGYSYDMAQGVEYELDLTRPAGDRVRNLRYRGKPLQDDQPLRIAVNSYRAAGSAGYSMFAGAKVVWKSGRGIRELLIDYYTERGRLPVTSDGNWRILPAQAVETLAREDLRGH
jgi:2',3'-cyclic-nucleotide 2'-phosphodiesterase (5'-nucleotidase family)